MNTLRVIVARLLGRGRTDRELDSELATHVELLAADLKREGWEAGAARAEARRRLGNVTAVHETYREQRRLPFLDPLSQDLAYALRQLRRNPGFAAAAILTLALGVGANVAIYQALDAVVFRELPVRDPKGLVQIQLLENRSPVHVSYPLYRELAVRQTVLESVFAVSDFPLREAVLRDRGELRGVRGSLVSGNYFRALGVSASIGRMLREEDDRAGAPPVAVLSDAFWRREFAGNPGAIGQVLRINNTSPVVIGVAPAGFFGETLGSAPDVWLPVGLQPQVMPGDWLNAPSSSWLTVLGRLRPGVSREQAQAALDPLYARLIDLTPTHTGQDYRVQLQAGNRGVVEVQRRFERPLWLLMGVAGLVLLIACSNLASLLLARATAREGEIGVRLALGAGRTRLVRQLLTESALLGALGAIAAIPLARAGTTALVTLASGEQYRIPVQFGWNVLGFTLAIAGVAVCLFGLAPAMAATRLDVHAALQSGRALASGGRRRLRQALIVAQIAISLTLLSGAAQFGRSLWNLRHQNFGFDAAQVLAADLPVEFKREMMRRQTALRAPLYEAVNRIPGVRSVAVASFGLLGSMQHTVTASTAERPMAKDDFVRRVHVSERYFETLGIPILAGRAITAEDREKSTPVVVLSQTAARAFFGGADPIGRYVSSDRQFNASKVLRVIGVAHDVRFASARDPFGAVEYVPLEQEPAPVTAVLVRPAGDPVSMTGTLRAAIKSVDPNVRVGQIRPLDQILDAGLGTERTLAFLSASFGLLAVALTCIGVYGVIAYGVRRRTREIGVRIALGAARESVTRMLMAGLGRLLAIGLAIGAAGSVAAGRAMRGVLFGVEAGDYSMPVAAGLLLIAVALAAGYLPARRAARLDPMTALRQE